MCICTYINDLNEVMLLWGIMLPRARDYLTEIPPVSGMRNTPSELLFSRVQNISLQIYATATGSLPEHDGKPVLLKTTYTLDLGTGRTEAEKQDIC